MCWRHQEKQQEIEFHELVMDCLVWHKGLLFFGVYWSLEFALLGRTDTCAAVNREVYGVSNCVDVISGKT